MREINDTSELVNLIVARPGRGIIMPIGGAEDKAGAEDILTTFVALAGGQDAHIALIPTASEDPMDAVARYDRLFRDLGAAEVMPILGENRHAVDREDSLALLRRATGIFISGGDQARLAELFTGTEAGACILERNREGIIVGGTSAGAAFMASHMIFSGESRATPIRGKTEVGEGLGLLRNVVVDTHFGERGRTGRLLEVLAAHPELIAMGLDEDTAAVIDEHLLIRVVGSGVVTVVDGSSVRSNYDLAEHEQPLMVNGAELHTIPADFSFDLRARKFIPPPRPTYR